MTQLQPSNGRPLHLLSIQLTPCARGANGGFSLSTFVTSIQKTATNSEINEQFLARLRATGWRDDHARHYKQTYLLRTEPTVVPVDSSCPRITFGELNQLSGNPIERIKAVSYRIDVTGLGHTQMNGVITDEDLTGN